ncbi:hypothetical protein VNO78_34114 [Psophocarpus tetragonolobus]|uniref:Uncharacterized protein n=1 Tax=Psophocarpus tetragonolobus TaxID=3891 RepID=A0AAN9NYB3_PSOTE
MFSTALLISTYNCPCKTVVRNLTCLILSNKVSVLLFTSTPFQKTALDKYYGQANSNAKLFNYCPGNG